MKKIIVSTAIAACSILIFNTSQAQIAMGKVMFDRSGNPIGMKDYTDVIGSPFLTEKWSAGSYKMADGRVVTDSLKYNMLEDEVYFRNEAGETLAFAEPVPEFTITYRNEDGEVVTGLFRKGFTGINRTTEKSYFQVLSDGKAQLLKKVTKGVVMSQDYNSASKTKNIKEETKYYLVVGGKSTQVKKDKKVILAALADKQAQVEAYAKTNNINFKSDADLAKVVTYYNSL